LGRGSEEEFMARLLVFNSVSLDGFFTDSHGDMSWAHNPRRDEAWDSFVEGNARGDGVLVFGRITYDLMKSYWPTPAAMQYFPSVAERMNNLPKVVFSRSLESATWDNSRLVKENMASEVRQMKRESGSDLVILGSGSIVSQLTQERLIDEYQIVIVPVILVNGRTLFESVRDKVMLDLLEERTFANGNVFLRYRPVP
jgi:dihydrofolate reductase